MIGMMSLPLALRLATTADARERSETAMSEEEFRAFYERTARPLWAYLSRITGDPHEADDVLQEAYYRFYRSCREGARHEGESHRKNSLFRIATNIVRDAARAAARRPRVPLDDELGDGRETADPRAPEPEGRAADRSELTRAMEALEPLQRRMLWMAYAQGASHREIAEVTGVRTVSVRTLLLRARRKAAEVLRGGPDAAGGAP